MKSLKKNKRQNKGPEKVAALPTLELHEHDALCSICLQPLTRGKQLPCKHLFHTECLE